MTKKVHKLAQLSTPNHRSKFRFDPPKIPILKTNKKEWKSRVFPPNLWCSKRPFYSQSDYDKKWSDPILVNTSLYIYRH